MSDTRSLTLYEIESELAEMMDLWGEAATPDAREACEKAIAAYVVAEIAKVDGIRGYIRNAEAAVVAAKEEAARQTGRVAVWQRRIDRLKAFCLRVMQDSGKRKLEGRTGSLTVCGNGGAQAVEITDESLLPNDVKQQHVNYIIDMDLIRRRLAAGEIVPGARLLERGHHLRISL